MAGRHRGSGWPDLSFLIILVLVAIIVVLVLL